MRFLIVTGGTVERKLVETTILNGSYDVIIAADSGMDVFYTMNTLPDVIVGDFDSADKTALDYFKEQEMVEIIELNPIKDDTDTEFAIRYAISNGAEAITIIGATGSRLDHVLGNISLLGIGLEENVEIEILDSYNRVRIFNKSFKIRRDEQYGRYVSLIPYGGPVRSVSIIGMKYRLDDYDMGGFNSLGISNEIIDSLAEVSFEEGYLLVIESKDK